MLRVIWVHRLYYAYLLPFLLLTVVFGFWPIFKSVQMSFMESFTALSDAPIYVGLENYRTIFQDAYFLDSLWITAKFTLIVVPLAIAASLFLAIGLSSSRIGRWGLVFKIAIFTPVIVPDVVGGIVWRWMFNKDIGAVNAVLNAVGLPSMNWLSDPGMALYTLMFVEMWKHIGLYMIIFLTNLSIIDRSVYEAAHLEGAKLWQRLWYITIPELKPAFVLNIVYASIQFLKTFTVAAVMTQGGPNYATNFVSYYAYKKFTNLEYGVATAMSTVLFAVVLAATLATFYLMKRRNER